MGDQRVKIEIKVRAHSQEKKFTLHTDYLPDENGIDYGVNEWLKKVWVECKARKEARLNKLQAQWKINKQEKENDAN